jgi:hypothetical protein
MMIEEIRHGWHGLYVVKIPAVRCCGRWLECRGLINTCEVCDADYNWAGQRLARFAPAFYRRRAMWHRERAA